MICLKNLDQIFVCYSVTLGHKITNVYTKQCIQQDQFFFTSKHCVQSGWWSINKSITFKFSGLVCVITIAVDAPLSFSISNCIDRNCCVWVAAHLSASLMSITLCYTKKRLILDSICVIYKHGNGEETITEKFLMKSG